MNQREINVNLNGLWSTWSNIAWWIKEWT